MKRTKEQKAGTTGVVQWYRDEIERVHRSLMNLLGKDMKEDRSAIPLALTSAVHAETLQKTLTHVELFRLPTSHALAKAEMDDNVEDNSPLPKALVANEAKKGRPKGAWRKNGEGSDPAVITVDVAQESPLAAAK